MAPIVKDLAALPDQDIRAMAVYLGSFYDSAIEAKAQDALAAHIETSTKVTSASSPGARLYLGACAVCHEVGGLPLFGSRPSLALNTSLHAATPDNLVQVVLHGITEPAFSDLGYMPGFQHSMSDAQVEELVAFLRGQFAPDKPAWTGIGSVIARARAHAN
jgi:nicotinate dehydrogenase subunit B